MSENKTSCTADSILDRRVVNTLLACIVESSNTISVRASHQKECLRISNLTDQQQKVLRIRDKLEQDKEAGQGSRTRIQNKDLEQGCRTRIIVGNWSHQFVV